MVICVDFDDVINDLLGAWIVWLNTKYNYTITVEDVVYWDMTKVYKGLTKEQIFEPLMTENFWGTVGIKEGAVETLKRLQADGHEIYICTRTHPSVLGYKYNKLVVPYLPFIDERHIILAYKKQMIKCDILIDDNSNYLVGGEYKGILFDMPYNRGVSIGGVVRVRDWNEIYDAVNNLTLN